MAPFRLILPLLALFMLVTGCAHRPEIRDRRVVVMDFLNSGPGSEPTAESAAAVDRSSSLAEMLTAELVNIRASR